MGTPIGPGADQGGRGLGDLRAWELGQPWGALPFPQTPWRVDLLPPNHGGIGREAKQWAPRGPAPAHMMALGGLAGSTLEADGQMEVVVCGSTAAEVPCYLNWEMEMAV